MVENKKIASTDVFMLLAVLFWAVNFSVIKIALREFPPLGFNGIRLFLASLILLLILLFRRERFSLDKSDIVKFFILSIVGNTIYQWLFIHGINWTTASNTSVVMAMTPVFIAVLSTLLKHERLHWTAWLGICISFIGFYLVITRQFGTFRFSWETLRGDLTILAGNFCWAIYTVFSRPLLEKISPLKLTAITMSIGTVFYLPFCLREIIRLRWSAVSSGAWASLLYSTLFALVISYIIWYTSVKRLGNTKTAIYGNITPVFAMLFAYLFITEKITLLQVAGALIIIGGVYLTRSGYKFFE